MPIGTSLYIHVERERERERERETQSLLNHGQFMIADQGGHYATCAVRRSDGPFVPVGKP